MQVRDQCPHHATTTPEPPILGVREALAVAIVKRRKELAHEAADWKEKALTARKVIVKCSKVLRNARSAGQNDAAHALIQVLLHETLPAEQEEDARECAQRSKAATAPEAGVACKASKLQEFIDTIQVINLLQDMKSGKLKSVWQHGQCQQLSIALQGTLLRLPDSALRTTYLTLAVDAMLHFLKIDCHAEPALEALLLALLAATCNAPFAAGDQRGPRDDQAITLAAARPEPRCVTTDTDQPDLPPTHQTPSAEASQCSIATAALPGNADWHEPASAAPRQPAEPPIDHGAASFVLSLLAKHPVTGAAAFAACVRASASRLSCLMASDNFDDAMRSAAALVGLLDTALTMVQELPSWLAAFPSTVAPVSGLAALRSATLSRLRAAVTQEQPPRLAQQCHADIRPPGAQAECPLWSSTHAPPPAESRPGSTGMRDASLEGRSDGACVAGHVEEAVSAALAMHARHPDLSERYVFLGQQLQALLCQVTTALQLVIRQGGGAAGLEHRGHNEDVMALCRQLVSRCRGAIMPQMRTCGESSRLLV